MKTKLELCTDCLQIFVEHSLKDSYDSIYNHLIEQRGTLLEGEDTLGSLMVGYCLASGVTLESLVEYSPTLPDVIDNLIKRYQD